MEDASHSELTRYQLVSRRALLKVTAGIGAALVLPVACGNDDAAVFAGALASASEPAETAPLAVPEPTSPGVEATLEPQGSPTGEPVQAEPTSPAGSDAAPPAPTAPPDTADTPTPAPTADPLSMAAVAGEMVISFTYTRGPTGKIERPYVAVWIEDQAGELVDTVSLWFQQERRGERWLDHLDRWYLVDQDRIIESGINDSATVSSATREPGAYAVVWDGSVQGVPAAAGQYFVCIEAARENGPYSLIRQAFMLTGSLPATPLTSDGELSEAQVRIDA